MLLLLTTNQILFFILMVFSESHALTGKIRTDTAPALYIGIRGDLSSSERFNGSIDEVKIYNRALSADEIAAEYSRGTPTTTNYLDEVPIREGAGSFHLRPTTGAGTFGTERIFELNYDKSAPTTSAAITSGTLGEKRLVHDGCRSDDHPRRRRSGSRRDSLLSRSSRRGALRRANIPRRSRSRRRARIISAFSRRTRRAIFKRRKVRR